MKTTLILAANSEWALWIHSENNHFEVIEEREHPESKEKVAHLVSDQPGRTFSRVSATRHALNEGQNVLETERQKFAREVFTRCQERYRVHPFHELWIVTGPKFLGELRPLFQEIPARPYSIVEIHKELSPHESLNEKLDKILAWVHGDAPKKGAHYKSLNLHEIMRRSI